MSFKIMHRIYPTNAFMVKYCKTINPNCSFCKEYPETISHLFWKCTLVKQFWKDCLYFINCKIDSDFLMRFENVIFGCHDCNMDINKRLSINLILLFSKFHIHKCKFTSGFLFFPVVINEIELYLSSISKSSNKKAIFTLEHCTSLNAFKCK